MPDTAKCSPLAISFNPHLILGGPVFAFYKWGGKGLGVSLFKTTQIVSAGNRIEGQFLLMPKRMSPFNSGYIVESPEGFNNTRFLVSFLEQLN